jgi:hypothetical protein
MTTFFYLITPILFTTVFMRLHLLVSPKGIVELPSAEFYNIGSIINFGPNVIISTNNGDIQGFYHFEKRQELRINGIRIIKSDPLAFFTAQKIINPNKYSAHYYCPPNIVEITDADISNFKDLNPSIFDYRGFREFQNGDNIKLINWNKFANSDELLVKIVGKNVSNNIKLRLDLKQYGNFELILSKFYSYGISLFENGEKNLEVNGRTMNKEQFARYCASI